MEKDSTRAIVLYTCCAILLVMLVFFVCQYAKLKQFSDHAYLPQCYSGASGGGQEWGERDVAYKFTDPDACVLEFGGGSGSVSLVVQRILKNPRNHVVVQPADSSEMFGGLVDEYNKNPSLFDHIKMIQVERDDKLVKHKVVGGKDYSTLFRRLHMHKVFSGLHSNTLTVEVWVRD